MENNTNVLNPYSEQSYSRTLFINVYRILFGIFAILGNGLILYTIARHPSVRRNLCNLLIGVLAFADFWTGLAFFFGSNIGLSFQMVPWYNYTTGECLMIQFFGLSGIQMSQIATIFIALDRLKAVQDPLVYPTQDRIHRSLLAFTVTVTYSLISTAFIFVGIDFNSFPKPLFCSAGSVLNRYFVIYWNVFAIIVAIIVVICYVKTHCTMSRKLSSASSDRLNRELAKQRAVFKTITIVLVVYGLCWCLPNVGFLLANILGADAVILGLVSPILAFGTGINASANVLVYAWKHKELGAAMRRNFSSRKETGASDISFQSLQKQYKRKSSVADL